jgi:two-component system sensor histidine kinase MtrB
MSARLRLLVSAATEQVARLQQAWRRSLQLRVVAITLLTSGTLVLTFGIAVTGMITSGLFERQEDRAEKQVDAGSKDALGPLGLAGGARSPALVNSVLSVVDNLSTRVSASNAQVAILPGEPDMELTDGRSSPDAQAYRHVPAIVRADVARLEYSSRRLRLDLGDGEKLYLVMGRQLRPSWDGTLELYYFFPLDDEVGQAALVTNTITVTGLALVFMLAGVAYLVTRMVVSPVRVAARTAQRLSNGLLDQRMEVRGEDDLAALAASFNQMAENLQRHILRLEDMSRLQRRFTSDVSHELRTPLTTVRMAADLLFSQRDEFDGPAARSAELLQAELDRFEALLAELLEISRFDAGFAALDSEPANLGPLVQRVVDRLATVAQQAGVTVETDLPAEPVVAEVDVRRVERILRNLVGNAIEHGEGRPVKVRLRAREGAAAITVRDHGVGLRPGEEKLVFNRFWRADPSRDRKTGGTGLGLSISAEDARLHGGWLDAWGMPGRGAQFRLTLPTGSGAALSSSPLRLAPTDAVLRDLDDAPAAGAGAEAHPVAAAGGVESEPVLEPDVAVESDVVDGPPAAPVEPSTSDPVAPAPVPDGPRNGAANAVKAPVPVKGGRSGGRSRPVAAEPSTPPVVPAQAAGVPAPVAGRRKRSGGGAKRAGARVPTGRVSRHED